ncbi:MAG TPA: dihydrofolate reductase family protein [Arthrobacter sp.]
MRKVIFMMQVSLDGYFEGPDQDLDWHRVDDELHRHFNNELRTMGAFLDGRVTYELMAGFWPTVDQDPSAPAPMAEFAGIWRDMPKIVYSRTLASAGWNTEVVRDVVAGEVTRLKEEPGGDLALGGANLAASFRRLGLIDEYRIYVHPVLIGRGNPLFQETGAMTPLRLLESRTFGNGVVLLRYAVEPAAGHAEGR